MDDAGFLRVQLNRAELYLPRETVRTMVHCLHLGPQGELTLLVETDHYDWMAAQIKPGDHFIDVGSATGAICLPLAKRFGANLPIIAFEPARLARALLLSTCRRNNLNSIRVIGKAVSNQKGRVPFYELPQDDLSPWLPEGSTLAAGDERAERVDVMVTTLDAEFESFFARPRIQSAVMKIDVEGFETKVLEGDRGFLQRVRPSIAIDIHANPFGEGTTEPSCRQILEAWAMHSRRRTTSSFAHLCVRTTGNLQILYGNQVHGQRPLQVIVPWTRRVLEIARPRDQFN